MSESLSNDEWEIVMDESPEDKTLLNDVENLLRTLTRSNKDEVTKQFLSFNVSLSPGSLDEIIKMIVINAIYQPFLAPAYAELCRDQVDTDLFVKENVSPFRDALLRNFQKQLETKNIQNSDSKLYKKGISAFIALTYSLGLIHVNIIKWSIRQLLRHSQKSNGAPVPPPFKEGNLQCVARMLSIAGKAVELEESFNGQEYIDEIFSKLKRLAGHCEMDTRCIFARLAMIRARNWVQRYVRPRCPIKAIREEFKEACAGKDNVPPNEEYEHWKRILREFSIPLSRPIDYNSYVMTHGKIAADNMNSRSKQECFSLDCKCPVERIHDSRPRCRCKEKSDMYYCSQSYTLSNLEEEEMSDNVNDSNCEDDCEDNLEIEEDILKYMKDEHKEIETSTRSVRKKITNVYKVILELENARDMCKTQDERKEFATTIIELEDLCAKVSASIMANNYFYILNIDVRLQTVCKSAATNNENAIENVDVIKLDVEENFKPTQWMEEQYQKVEKSHKELREKAILLYKKIAETNRILFDPYVSGHKSGRERQEEHKSMQTLRENMSSSILTINSENQKTIKKLLDKRKATMHRASLVSRA